MRMSTWQRKREETGRHVKERRGGRGERKELREGRGRKGKEYRKGEVQSQSTSNLSNQTLGISRFTASEQSKSSHSVARSKETVLRCGKVVVEKPVCSITSPPLPSPRLASPRPSHSLSPHSPSIRWHETREEAESEKEQEEQEQGQKKGNSHPSTRPRGCANSASDTPRRRLQALLPFPMCSLVTPNLRTSLSAIHLATTVISKYLTGSRSRIISLGVECVS
eukprot:764635-Hanusia_phi.AAC.1